MLSSRENTSHSPRASVIMTTYNGARFVESSVQAILDQTFTDLELIIVDDGSTDGTLDMIRRYPDKRIRLIQNESNKGISISRNRAFSLARGEYVACNDQDDISHRNRLAREIDYLEGHPDIAMVSTAVEITNGYKTWLDPMPTFANPSVLHMSLFFGHHNITYSTVCARIDVLRSNKLEFRQEFHYAEDFEYYHRLAKVGPILTLPDFLVTSRIHEGNTSNVRGEQMATNGRRFLANEYRELLGREISDADIELIWRLLVRKLFPRDRSELERIGEMIRETSQAFEQKYVSTQEEAAATQGFTSQLWWRLVCTGAATTIGSSGLSIYQQYPEIASYRPSAAEIFHIGIKSITPRKLRERIKSWLRPENQKRHK